MCRSTKSSAPALISLCARLLADDVQNFERYCRKFCSAFFNMCGEVERHTSVSNPSLFQRRQIKVSALRCSKIGTTLDRIAGSHRTFFCAKSEKKSAQARRLHFFVSSLLPPLAFHSRPLHSPIFLILRPPFLWFSAAVPHCRSTLFRRAVQSLMVEVYRGNDYDACLDRLVIGSSAKEADPRPPLKTKQKFPARKQKKTAAQAAALE